MSSKLQGRVGWGVYLRRGGEAELDVDQGPLIGFFGTVDGDGLAHSDQLRGASGQADMRYGCGAQSETLRGAPCEVCGVCAVAACQLQAMDCVTPPLPPLTRSSLLKRENKHANMPLLHVVTIS